MTSANLLDAFVAALDQEQRSHGLDRARLEPAVDAVVAEARREWPNLGLSDEAFLAHVAAHLARDVSVESALAAIRPGDLYLAAACATGDARAIRSLEERYLAQVDAAWRKIAPSRLAL